MAPPLTLADTSVLDCGICYQPLKPPIFQCDEGHALCSSCHDKLLSKGKCPVCGISTDGGYCRSRALERVVESIHGVCPNAAYGCDARPVYYDLARHRQVCAHAPCHCPGEACRFMGTMTQLVQHVTSSSHRWPYTIRTSMPRETGVCLEDGFNFLIVDYNYMCDDERAATATTSTTTSLFVFLLDVSRQPHGRTISVFRICPQQTCDLQGPSSRVIKCSLTYYSSSQSLHSDDGQGPSSVSLRCSPAHSRSHHKRKLASHHYLNSDLSVQCTDSSGRLPVTEECFKFVVPNSALGDKDTEHIIVRVGFTIG